MYWVFCSFIIFSSNLYFSWSCHPPPYSFMEAAIFKGGVSSGQLMFLAIAIESMLTKRISFLEMLVLGMKELN